jgi:hypothetical protein
MGLPSGYVNCVSVDPTDSDNVIAILSNYNLQNLWCSTNDGSFDYSDVIDVDVPTLNEYAILFQNYPNPLNSQTKIQFMVNDNTRVSLGLSI